MMASANALEQFLSKEDPATYSLLDEEEVGSSVEAADGYLWKALHASYAKESSDTCSVHGLLAESICNRLKEINGNPLVEIVSPDAMTSFKTMFKMAVCVARRGDGQDFSKSFTFCNAGFHDAEPEVLLLRYEELTAFSVFGDFEEELEKYARLSFSIGNYQHMPNSCGKEKELNNRKGSNYGGMLRLENGYLVNDQFALFSRWYEEQRKNEADETVYRNWIDCMVLNRVLRDYADAEALYYKMMSEESSARRIDLFAQYLHAVNNCIEKRGTAMVDRLQTSVADA